MQTQIYGCSHCQCFHKLYTQYKSLRNKHVHMMTAYHENYELAMEYKQLCEALEDKEEKYMNKMKHLKNELRKELEFKKKLEQTIQVCVCFILIIHIV